MESSHRGLRRRVAALALEDVASKVWDTGPSEWVRGAIWPHLVFFSLDSRDTKRCWGRSNVLDPRYFGTDPDPRIRTTDLRIRIQIRLFSSVADKQPTKNFSKGFLLTIFFVKVPLPMVHYRYVFKDKKSKRSHKKVEKKVFFSLFWLVDPDLYKIMTDPGLGGPKTHGSYESGSTTLGRSGPKSVQMKEAYANSVYYVCTVSSCISQLY